MKLLLDTHALLWWGNGDRRLGRTAFTAISEDRNDVFVSAVSALEVATKHRLGKLPEAQRLAANFESDIEDEGFVSLPVTIPHARLAGSLLIPHGDPFDRVLIAQSMLEGMTLVSNEILFDAFGVSRIW